MGIHFGRDSFGPPAPVPQMPLWRPPGWQDDAFHFGLPAPCLPSPFGFLHHIFKPPVYNPWWPPAPKPTYDLVPTALNASLDDSATDGNGHLLVGTGIPAAGFQVQHNEDAGIEGALSIVYRQGHTIEPYSVDNKGVLHFYVPQGTQVVDPAHGVPSANANRAAWSFNFSVDALDTHKLGEYNIHLKIDLDPSIKVKYLDLVLDEAPTGWTGSESGFVWKNAATGQIVIADDGGILDHVTQNSVNFAFNFIKSQIDIDPNTAGIQPYNFGPGIFDIELTASHTEQHPVFQLLADRFGGGWASHTVSKEVIDIDVHAQVDVVPATDYHLVA